MAWYVYDVEFQRRASHNLSAKWGERDVQLYLDTFTGLPKSGCRSCSSTDHLSDTCPLSPRRSRDALAQSDLCYNFNKGRPCARIPCPYQHRCNQLGCSAAHSGEEHTKLTRHREDRPKSSSGSGNSSRGQYLSQLTPPTPIDINTLASFLQGHPDPTIVNHLLSGFSQGFKIGYSGPRAPKEYSNLPCANSNPSIIDKNMLKEVTLGHTAGPFCTPPSPTCRYTPLGSFPRNTLQNGTLFFTSPTPNTAPPVSTPTFLLNPILCNT